MSQFNQKVCALPECAKPINGRGFGSCCCRSHQAKYSAKKRHGTLGKPNQTKEEWQEWQRNYHKEKYYESKGVAYRRRDLKLLTPLWANLIEIDQIYVRAKQMSYETGIDYEVDHIVPLIHPLVCGLHVEHNLQILTSTENAQKSNKFLVE